jgi:hypothetical protein
VSFKKISAMTFAIAALVSTSTFAQDKNLSTLQRMGNTDTNMNIATAQNLGAECNISRLATDRCNVILQGNQATLTNFIS